MAESESNLDQAAQVWAKAQLVWIEPSRQGRPRARVIAEEIAAAAPDQHEGLVDLLSSPNQLVAAYALLALELIKSPILAELPVELLSRRGSVAFRMGSFRATMSLGDYASRIRDRARQRF